MNDLFLDLWIFVFVRSKNLCLFRMTAAKRRSPAANAASSDHTPAGGKRRRRARGGTSGNGDDGIESDAAAAAPSLLATIDVEVVKVGKRLGLDGWSEQQVRAAITPHALTTVVCWYDCHPFDWVPCRIPLKKDERFGVYYATGSFCSYECAKAHCLQDAASRTGAVSLIAVEANKSRRRYLRKERCVDGGILLRNLPRKEKLQMFGGKMSIEQLRNGCTRFDGSVIGEENPLSVKLLKQVRNDMLPPAFLDESIVSVLRCVSVGGVTRPTSHEAFKSHARQQKSQSGGNDNDHSLQQRISLRANEVDPRANRSNLLSSMGLTVSSR